MAIYHLEAKVVSRGTGRSAVAASAYLSCTNILNDYDGVRHDYTRKKGLIWREVFLPEYSTADRINDFEHNTSPQFEDLREQVGTGHSLKA